MIDHVKLQVSNLGRSRAFYVGALMPLGYSVVIDRNDAEVGMGTRFPDFWLAQGEPTAPAHIAFRVESRAIVDAFHAAALKAGGTDNGAPGVRAHYHPGYYGAFVLDPDGNNVEAVHHTFPGSG